MFGHRRGLLKHHPPSVVGSAPMTDKTPPSSTTTTTGAAAAVTPVLANERKRSGLFFRVFRFALFVGCVGVLAGVAAGAVLFVAYSRDLPEFTSVDQYRPKLSTKVLSVDGRLIGEFYNERRVVVPYERIPKRLIQAFIAVEDQSFFDHHGIDQIG